VPRGDGRNLAGWPPTPVNVAAATALVFAADGTPSGAPATAINIGPHVVNVDAGGWIQRQ
jgi:hypothetical protein